MAVRIDGGCTQINADTWKYIVQDNDSPGGIIYIFTANQVPKLGDEISNGGLVPREIVAAEDNPLSPFWPEPIINNDPGFQKKKMGPAVDVWGRDEKPV